MTSSLRSRYRWDCIKRWMADQWNMALPVAQYGAIEYWNYLHRDLEQQPVSLSMIKEWANVSYKTLETYQYRILPRPPQQYYSAATKMMWKEQQQSYLKSSSSSSSSSLSSATNATPKSEPMTTFRNESAPLHTTTLLETLGLSSSSSLSSSSTSASPREDDDDDDDDDDGEQGEDEEESSEELENVDAKTIPERSPPQPQQQHPILILGCGTSALGADLLDSGLYAGPIHQVDWCPSVIQAMSELYQEHVRSGPMTFAKDTATQLSSLQGQPNFFRAVIDKGLLDPLSCTYEIHNHRQEQVQDIFRSVHRVLKPHGYFCVWSLSQPEFFLSALQQDHYIQQNNNNDNDNKTGSGGGGGRHVMWQNLEIRHDISKGCILYRFQKASEQIVIRNDDLKKSHKNANKATKKKKKGKKQRL
ncbi:hypothetical protein ACA910_020308 [Epithemia clementina (nom. ined.)]